MFNLRTINAGHDSGDHRVVHFGGLPPGRQQPRQQPIVLLLLSTRKSHLELRLAGLAGEGGRVVPELCASSIWNAQQHIDRSRMGSLRGSETAEFGVRLLSQYLRSTRIAGWNSRCRGASRGQERLTGESTLGPQLPMRLRNGLKGVGRHRRQPH